MSLSVIVSFKKVLEFSALARFGTRIRQAADLEEAINLSRPHVFLIMDQVVKYILADIALDESAKRIYSRASLLRKDFQCFSFWAPRRLASRKLVKCPAPGSVYESFRDIGDTGSLSHYLHRVFTCHLPHELLKSRREKKCGSMDRRYPRSSC